MISTPPSPVPPPARVSFRWRSAIAVLVAGALLAGSASAIAGEKERDRSGESADHYESPILSLLFLPVTVLIRMASVFAPAESATGEPRRSSSADRSQR